MWIKRKDRSKFISEHDLESSYFSACYLVVNNMTKDDFVKIATLRELIQAKLNYNSEFNLNSKDFAENINETDSILLSHIKGLNSVPAYPGAREAKSHWWYWLDKLDELPYKIPDGE